MPIDVAVARNASREAGSNAEARRARGLEALTLRWLGMSLPPNEDWVTLTYSDNKESRIQWQIVEPNNLDVPSGPEGQVSLEGRAAIGLDVKTELLRRVRKALFNAPALKVDAEMAEYRRRGAPPQLRRSACCPTCIPSSARSNAARDIRLRAPGHVCAGKRRHRRGGERVRADLTNLAAERPHPGRARQKVD